MEQNINLLTPGVISRMEQLLFDAEQALEMGVQFDGNN